MAEHDDKAGLPLSQTKKVKQQLSQLEDQLHHLLASYQFYDHAIRSMTDPRQLDESEAWYFGLFLNQQWLRRQGETIMAELVRIKQSLPA